MNLEGSLPNFKTYYKVTMMTKMVCTGMRTDIKINGVN
jgi:hypothetical protein